MFHSTDLFLVSIFAIFMGVESLPAAEVHAVFPEVIPGPGLPSLASLGITSEQLHTMPPEFHPLGTLSEPSTSSCTDSLY